MKALALTIDVEADAGLNGTWATHDPLSFTGVKQGLVRLMQEVPEATPLTLLISHEVALDEHADFLLQSWGTQHELGLHLHPDDPVPGQARTQMFCNLNWAERTRLLQERITKFYIDYLTVPTSIRVGRFGVRLDTLIRLAEAGLVADCSFTPGLTRDQGVDHRNLNNNPIICVPGPYKLVSFPTTVVGDCWIRPSFCSIPQIRQAMEGADYGVAMWSSREAVAGRSPYTHSEHGVCQFLDSVRFICKWAADNGVPIMRLTDMAKMYFKEIDYD